MRALVVGLVVSVLAAAAPAAEAKPRRERDRQTEPRVERAARAATPHRDKRKRTAIVERARGQSIGAPWSGRLERPTRLRLGDGAHIRRPLRAYGTKTTVDHVRRAINETLDAFPRLHVLAVGDLSQRQGGAITEHASHQSGRDIDLGLFFRKRPAGYPAAFVDGNDHNLDYAATWALIDNLARTADRDGGLAMMFLDFDVQGLIYEYALTRGVPQRKLDRLFQWPHGWGSPAGIIRHEPYHADHLHARFKCAKADVACR